MEVESVLVTGANRGIGLEFVKQLVKLPKPPRFIFATFRNESTAKALQEIQDEAKQTEVVLIKMDVTEAEDIDKAQKLIEEKVGDSGLNLLINNAGVLRYQNFFDITEEDMLFHFRNNAIAPVMVLKKMFPLLQKAAARKMGGMSVSRAAVLNIAAFLGSVTELTETYPEKWLTVMSYRTSKAALNMAMRVVALTVKDQGVLVVNMCPGWVKTDMGTENGLLEITDSVSSMMETLARLDESHQGVFVNRKGKTIPF
ncbi:C-factor-like [Argiope bruennichi]|uniref:C-factor-like n=1 Tax=Argiope bruennichi TaxID=94029 RepID=UPI0024945F48|nr:C-factor-like [Argiope bruennichi]